MNAAIATQIPMGNTIVKEISKAEKICWMEELGLDRVNKLDEEICLARVRYLKRGLRHGRYEGKREGKLEEHAKYYVNWYAWMAKKGGTRGRRA